MRSTDCRIEWRAIRAALGLTQEELADLLHVRARTIYNLEHGVCTPNASTVLILRCWLSTPALSTRLAESNYPHPFPDDLDEQEDTHVPQTVAAARTH